LGTLLTFCKLSSFIGARFLASIYTSIFRGTPLILQLSLICYAGLGVTGYNIAVWQAGVLSFSLNSAAYVSEIMRAGVQSIDRGQFEAANALGIPRFLTFKDIFPQAYGSSERNGRFTETVCSCVYYYRSRSDAPGNHCSS